MNPHPERKAVDAQTMISNLINTGFSQRDFISRMSRDHRTLQAGFTRLCLAWLERAAEQYKDGDYDLQNEDECKNAYLMVKSLYQF